jgi:hypothetical protein
MTKKEQDLEASIVKGVAGAYSIAEDLFGTRADAYATEEIYAWLEIAPSGEVFVEDLKRVIEHAKNVYKTETPSTEQVFGLFDLIFNPEED